jgi:hypothetical protein
MAVFSETWYAVRNSRLTVIDSDAVPSSLKTQIFPFFKTEQQLTNLLITYPDLIFEDLLVLQEDSEGKGGIDILGITTQGQLVVIETKKSTINAAALGQAIGYALFLDKEPKHLLPEILGLHDRVTTEYRKRITGGNASDRIPIIVIVGRNVAGTLMESIKYLAENTNGNVMEIIPVSLGYWESEEYPEGIICRRIHKHEKDAPVKWNDWKVGDIVQNMGSDADCDEALLIVTGIKSDGRIAVRRANQINNGVFVPIGSEITKKSLAHHRRIGNADHFEHR